MVGAATRIVAEKEFFVSENCDICDAFVSENAFLYLRCAVLSHFGVGASFGADRNWDATEWPHGWSGGLAHLRFSFPLILVIFWRFQVAAPVECGIGATRVEGH